MFKYLQVLHSVVLINNVKTILAEKPLADPSRQAHRTVKACQIPMWTPEEPNRMSWTYSSGHHWLRLVWALANIPSAIFHRAYVFIYCTLEGHILSYSLSSM
jgi:hypothetical protein